MAKGSTDEVESQVLYELRGDAAWIIINRPEKRNAMTGPMRERIMALLHESERNDAVRAIVFTGAGEHFTSGADLGLAYAKYEAHEAQYQPRPEGQEARRRTSQRTRLFVDRYDMADTLRKFTYCTKPIIVRAQGISLGLGSFIILASDICIASEDARIGFPEELIGFSGANPMLLSLIYSVGLKRSREMMLFGKVMSGAEATEVGLINRAVPRAQLDEEVERYLDQIRQIPKDGLAIGRYALNMAYDKLGMETQLVNWTALHTLFTNLRYEPGEYSLVKMRSQKGAKAAFPLAQKKPSRPADK